jgi:hypothetical protein
MSFPHENNTHASTQTKDSSTPNLPPLADTKPAEASRFTPKSINKRLIVLCDGSQPPNGILPRNT